MLLKVLPSTLLDDKALHHGDSLDDEELVGGRVSDNKPPICQLLEGVE